MRMVAAGVACSSTALNVLDPRSPYLRLASLQLGSMKLAHRHFPNSMKIRSSVVANIQDGSTSPTTFLTSEEAGLIELSSLDMHERFLCRLTVSSLNLLRVISEQEGIPIEKLNAGTICDWFQKDKEKREKDFESATLKW